MKLIVVTGPPCAGKSDYVAQRREPTDVVIDFDHLAHALGYPDERVAWPADDHAARIVALRARASAIKAAREIPDTGTAWIIASHTGPSGYVYETVTLDPGPTVCHGRAESSGRPASTHEQIDEWYAWRDATSSKPTRTW